MNDQETPMDKILENRRNKMEKERMDLEYLSKELYERIAIENFTVDEVISGSYESSFISYREIVFGGNSNVYKGGFTSQLILKVSSNKQDVPIKTVRFDGFSIVKAGDCISAQIPRYENFIKK